MNNNKQTLELALITIDYLRQTIIEKDMQIAALKTEIIKYCNETRISLKKIKKDLK